MIGVSFGIILRGLIFKNVIIDIFSGFLIQGIGTITTLLLIFLTMQEGKRDRRQLRQEGRKERYTSHLIKQIEFYSLLNSKFNEEIRKSPDNPAYILFTVLNNDVKLKYEYLAEDGLCDVLNQFYTEYYLSSEEEHPLENWQSLLKNLEDSISEEYEKLKGRYRHFNIYPIISK